MGTTTIPKTQAIHSANALLFSEFPITTHRLLSLILQGIRRSVNVTFTDKLIISHERDFPQFQELLTLECTVLVPAALAEQITVKNAADVRCQILTEAANGPTTLEADAMLQDRNIFIIPDILANAEGVIVSYFEWVQDGQHFFWKEADIHERLHDIITGAFQRTLAFSQEKNTSMRMAALMNGIDQVAQAHNLRGLYP